MLFLLLFFSSLFSQVSDEKTLSLDDCIDIAKRQNFDIKLTKSELNAAGANLTNAFGNYLPTIRLNSGFSRTSFQTQRTLPLLDPVTNQIVTDPVTGMPQTRLAWEFVDAQTYNMGLNANYTIFDGFNRESNYSQATKNLDATILNTEQTISDVILEVYRGYIDVINKTQIVKLRKQNLQEGKKVLDRINAQFEAGTTQKGDVYAQEAELGNREIALIQSENDLAVSKANLLSVMGLDPNEEYEFIESSLPTAVNDDEMLNFRKEIGSLDVILEEAKQNRADYEAVSLRLQISEEGITRAKSNYFPTVSANAGWNWANQEIANFDKNGRLNFGVSMNMPIFQNFSINNNVQQSRLQYEQNRTQLMKFEQNLKTQLKTIYLNLQAAEKQLDITNRTVKSSELNYQSTKERFEIGVANIVELTAANTQYITTQINRINSVYNYVLAQKELLYGIGKLD
jgi:outer membrane protein